MFQIDSCPEGLKFIINLADTHLLGPRLGKRISAEVFPIKVTGVRYSWELGRKMVADQTM